MNVQDIFDALQARALRGDRKLALVVPGGETLTFAELWENVERASAGLREAGLAPGDRVLFAVRPAPAAFVLILAIIHAGGVVVALDLGATAEVFRTRMKLVQPRWVAAESKILALSAFAPVRALLGRRGVDLPPLARLTPAGFITVGRWLPGAPRRSRRQPVVLSYATLKASSAGPPSPVGSDEAPVLMVFTSGTTAAPRVVVHSSRSVGATVALAAEHLALTPADRVYSAELHMVLPGLLSGATCLVSAPRPFSAQRALAEMRRYGATCTSGVPAEFLEVVEELARTQTAFPRKLRTVLLGAAPVHAAFLSRLQPYLREDVAVWCVYGATEILPLCRVRMRDKLEYAGGGDLVGQPFPGIGITIDETGELRATGPNLCLGYLGEPPLSEARTGDLGRIEHDGSVVLLGRSKDMIIRRHQNIYPELIEPTVAAIAGVRRCALVGIPSGAAGDEAVVLIIEPERGANPRQLLKRVRKELGEGPHRIDLATRPDRVVVGKLPLAGRSRKIDKAAARAMLTKHRR